MSEFIFKIKCTYFTCTNRIAFLFVLFWDFRIDSFCYTIFLCKMRGNDLKIKITKFILKIKNENKKEKISHNRIKDNKQL